MIPLLWPPCWSIWVRVKHVVRHGIKHHHAHRIGRAAKRAAGAAVSKPAVVGYVCLAVWWPHPVGRAQAAVETAESRSGFARVTYLPPELVAEMPPGPLYLPPLSLPPEVEIVGPPVEIATPTQPLQPMPEPSTLALLLPALAALIAWRRA